MTHDRPIIRGSCIQIGVPWASLGQGSLKFVKLPICRTVNQALLAKQGAQIWWGLTLVVDPIANTNLDVGRK